MAPTIKANEVVTADMSAYKTRLPSRWDVVIFRPTPVSEKRQQELWMMRIVGLPGETIEFYEDGIHINGKVQTQPTQLQNIEYSAVVASGQTETVSFPFVIPDNKCFVVGDNVNNSFDSRFWGALPLDSIVGKVEGK